MKFFRAFNYVYGCVGTTAFCVVLCHLLNAFCLPILLYGLEAVPCFAYVAVESRITTAKSACFYDLSFSRYLPEEVVFFENFLGSSIFRSKYTGWSLVQARRLQATESSFLHVLAVRFPAQLYAMPFEEQHNCVDTVHYKFREFPPIIRRGWGSQLPKPSRLLCWR